MAHVSLKAASWRRKCSFFRVSDDDVAPLMIYNLGKSEHHLDRTSVLH